MNSIDARRAIEALRAGVPNRNAVEQVGIDQPTIEERFNALVSTIPGSVYAGSQPPGFLILGDFGSGKSHVLQYMQHLALKANCACSLVIVSKENPLSNLHKILRTAVETMRLPDRPGRSGLVEVAGALKFNSVGYSTMHRRVNDPLVGYDPIFAATILLFERIRSDPQFHDHLIAFWSGDKLGLRDVKHALAVVGSPRFELRSRRVAELAIQRFRFAAELLVAVGYGGWVILLDEMELLASMGPMTRGKSYANIAKLAGRIQGSLVPGALVVGSLTTDFALEVFGRRSDDQILPAEFRLINEELADDVQIGIEFLKQDSNGELLHAPTRRTFQRVGKVLSEIYGAAYDTLCSDPLAPSKSQGELNMRLFVREIIATWDLERLYPGYVPNIKVDKIHEDLREIPDLEEGGDSGDDDAAIAIE